LILPIPEDNNDVGSVILIKDMSWLNLRVEVSMRKTRCLLKLRAGSRCCPYLSTQRRIRVRC